MIIWGGFQTGGITNTGSSYSPISDTWTTIANAPQGLMYPVSVWTGSEMLVWGGQEFDGEYLLTSEGFRYTPGTDSWSAMSTTDVPSPRTGSETIWTGSEMIVWGGYDSTSDYPKEVGSGGRYNPASDSWSPTSDTFLTARWYHSIIWTGSEMIVWGGFSNGGNATTRNGMRYSPDTDLWTSMAATNIPSGTHKHKAVWTGAEMIIWAGNNGNFTSALGAYYPLLEPLPELIFGGPGGGFEEPVADPGN